MTRRRRDPGAYLRGSILDPQPGEEHLVGLNVLEYALLTPKQRQPPIGPICSCPVPDPHRLGGQRPMLRWAAHDQLEPACGTCLKPIKQGIHKRRMAVHVLGLAELPIDALELADLADAGLLLEHPPRPVPPEADAWDPEVAEGDADADAVGDAWEPGVAEALRLLAEPPDLSDLAAPIDLARLVDAGSDFTDGQE